MARKKSMLSKEVQEMMAKAVNTGVKLLRRSITAGIPLPPDQAKGIVSEMEHGGALANIASHYLNYPGIGTSSPQPERVPTSVGSISSTLGKAAGKMAWEGDDVRIPADQSLMGGQGFVYAHVPQDEEFAKYREKWSMQPIDALLEEYTKLEKDSRQNQSRQTFRYAHDNSPVPPPRRKPVPPVPENYKGNIHLFNRPQIKDEEGKIRTLYSKGFTMDDGRHILLPLVSPMGKLWNDRQAKDNYLDTGKNLGIFDTEEQATAMGEQLSVHQNKLLNYASQEKSGKLIHQGSKYLMQQKTARIIRGKRKFIEDQLIRQRRKQQPTVPVPPRKKHIFPHRGVNV